MPEIKPVPYYNAKKLQIQNCHVGFIPDNAFSKLVNLKSLAIIGNSLRNMSSVAFESIPNLNDLDLSSNRITSFSDGMFSKLPTLKNLDLSENNAELSYKQFINSSLTQFRCHKCNLTGLPHTVYQPMTKLTRLDLINNKFTGVPEIAFDSLLSLEYLSLDSCFIDNIQSTAFQYLTSLSTLVIGNNKISEFPAMSSSLPKSLKRVHLEANRLTSLSEDSLPWKNLDETKLGANPWTCDCDMVWLKPYKQIVIDSDEVKCSAPSDHKDKKFFTLEASAICSRPRMALLWGITIPIILISVGLIVYYIWQIVRSRQKRALERNAFKYRSVYADTVESNSKQSIMS